LAFSGFSRTLPQLFEKIKHLSCFNQTILYSGFMVINWTALLLITIWICCTVCCIGKKSNQALGVAFWATIWIGIGYALIHG